MSDIRKAYELAKERYAALGVDSGRALERLAEIPLSLHCWQLDDIGGFEPSGGALTGGIQATGNYPGKAKNPDELRADFLKALSCVPGKNKIDLHASYLETGGKTVDRDAIGPEHFSGWADWACEHGVGVDINPTYFSHPLSLSGTLSSADEGVRAFWIEHGRRCRVIADYFGKRTGVQSVNNIWTPDGEKEFPVDSLSPRLRLKDSLDRILETPMDESLHLDSVEGKLFGIGSEAYVVGSHEFYYGYACVRGDVLLTLDTGHFHPTEFVSAKLSPSLLFVKGILLHVSRPMRWDSDHVVSFDDETRAIMRELVRLDCFDRVSLATDYFDASINRVLALATGARNVKKALLEALLQPVETLKETEASGDYGKRLALTEELKSMPFGAVWDYFCEKNGVLSGTDWIDDMLDYEKTVLSKR